MLVLFLILFTNVLADSEEDKYVDLLSDEEKQQFLEKVARRILKDVESQENVTEAQSGELSDEQLKRHTEYVKTVLKEEQENIRRSKGDNIKDIEDKLASDEKETLSVKPIGTEKLSLPDLTLREERRDTDSDESIKNNITIQMVTDIALIIKRSVKDDSANKSYESDETTSATLYRITKTNVTSEESIEVETTNEKIENGNVKTGTKALSGIVSKVNGSTTAEDENDESESVEGNQSISSENRNALVKGINKPLSRKSNSNDNILARNTTKINNASTEVGVKSTENKSDKYISFPDEKFTTLTYPSESSSMKNTTNDSITTNSLLSTTTIMKKNLKDSEPLQTSTNYISKDTENEVETTIKSTQTSTFTVEERTESVPATIEVVPETRELVPEITEMVPETTAMVPETTTDTEIMTTEAVIESTTVLVTTENTTESIPVVTTTDTNIVFEDFTSAPTTTTSDKSTTLTPRETTNKRKKKKQGIKQYALSEESTTVALGSHEESIEATTKKRIKHKVTVHKAHKYIMDPKVFKIAEAEKDDIQNKNFIELEKKYYDINYSVKVGNQYHVFEIPADKSTFIKDEEPMADQPYYVPIYNYSPDNVYFNPKNRLGPNAGDFSAENNAIFNDGDNINQLDKTETLDVNMEYSSTVNSKRKKFGSKQQLSHNIHKQPLTTNENNPRGKKEHEDYLDSDYYFGKVRKNLAKFPNSDEPDHPAHSIQEGSLKDYVRAVRNILFLQKYFGLLEKDKYGENVVNELRMGRMRSEAKQSLRKGPDNDLKNSNKNENKKYDKENNIATDYYFGREKPKTIKGINQDGINTIHLQKVGYLKKKNITKELYIMDDFFKANVQKYIKENGFTAASPLRYQVTTSKNNLDQTDEVIAYLRQEERKYKAENNNVNSMIKKYVSSNEEITIATQNQNDIPVNANRNSATEKEIDAKLDLRQNDIIKVSVYLHVLKDMVNLDNKALVQYDWLGTTVDIQAALQKLFELIGLVANEKDVHPADMEILKYVLFLHKLATEIIEASDLGAQVKKKIVLPRNTKKKLKRHLQKEKQLVYKAWLYLRNEVPQVNEHGSLKNLNTFLMDVEDSLYDLHDAIKNIANITKYRNQHWYQNLKDLYIDTDEKRLLELLLHMTSLRFFALIEESAKNGLEDGYIEYMKKNRKHSKRTLEEMMFLMEILDEYNQIVA